MNNDNEDDKPTVVINVKDLKELQQSAHTEMEEAVLDIEFSVTSDEESDEVADVFISETESAISTTSIILFDFQSNLFKEALPNLPKNFNYTVIDELKELNRELLGKDFKVVIFNYNANPKAINQLTAQIKSKLPHVKTIIVAKNLSPEKANAHSKSPSGANGYISLPLNESNVKHELMKILNE